MVRTEVFILLHKAGKTQDSTFRVQVPIEEVEQTISILSKRYCLQI